MTLELKNPGLVRLLSVPHDLCLSRMTCYPILFRGGTSVTMILRGVIRNGLGQLRCAQVGDDGLGPCGVYLHVMCM